MSAVTDAWSRLTDRIRHKEAERVAGQPGETGDFARLRGGHHALVVTFRKDGEPVPTPVWFGLDGDRKLYFLSEAHLGKVKRIKGDPHVRVGPCDNRGKPKGPLVEARARIVGPDEEEHAERTIASNFGAGRKLYKRTMGAMESPVVYVEVTPA